MDNSFSVYYYKIRYKTISVEDFILKVEEAFNDKVENYDMDLGYWELDNSHRLWFGYQLSNSENVQFQITEFFDGGYFIVETDHDEETDRKTFELESVIQKYSDSMVMKRFE